jgi:hypothetical protein
LHVPLFFLKPFWYVHQLCLVPTALSLWHLLPRSKEWWHVWFGGHLTPGRSVYPVRVHKQASSLMYHPLMVPHKLGLLHLEWTSSDVEFTSHQLSGPHTVWPHKHAFVFGAAPCVLPQPLGRRAGSCRDLREMIFVVTPL